jgi:pimeloyl-ACP methyl ester carboxylesterase
MVDNNEDRMPLSRRRFLTGASATLAASTLLNAAGSGSAEAAMLSTGGGITTGVVEANGLQFSYLTQGSGPLALCLHGFPDSPWSFRFLLPALASQGFRVVAPYMRGFAPTEIPADGNFKTSALAADVNALHEALGGDGNAVLVGHDWGAVAVYGGAHLDPARWRRCVIINIPPLAVYGQIGFSYAQIKRSFYLWFFQMAVSNGIVPASDFSFIENLWEDWSPGYDASVDLPYAKDCLRDPAHMQAAFGYYRTFFHPATFGGSRWSAEQGAVWGNPLSQPCLYLHGTQDGCIALDAQAATGVSAYLGPGSQVELVDGVGHFLIVEDPRRINQKIQQFLEL